MVWISVISGHFSYQIQNSLENAGCNRNKFPYGWKTYNSLIGLSPLPVLTPARLTCHSLSSNLYSNITFSERPLPNTPCKITDLPVLFISPCRDFLVMDIWHIVFSVQFLILNRFFVLFTAFISHQEQCLPHS